MPPEETSPNIFKISRNQAGIPSMNYVAPATINQYKNYCEDREFVAQCDELCSAAVISPRPQKVTIPGRSRKVIRIGLIQTNLKEGYLPRLDVGYDDVYIGEGIVKNEEGYCNIYAINTQEEEVELNLDPVEIQSFDYVVQDFESDGATELDTPPIEDVKARCDRILKTLRLSELNQEEMESIKGLVMDYPDLFLLPGDSLPCTNWIRQFLGMAGYYRRFIQDFSKIAKPLHDLTKKGTNFNWSSECENSFQTLKKCLTSAPILIFPDFSKPFILTTDASDLAIGAVLSQEEGFEHPIGYLSRVLNKAEVNYSTTEKECLAALYAMYQYRPYLLGRPFTLVADHEPLNWMHNRKDPGQRLMRWMFKFTGYQYTFKYKPGKENVVADCLSRNPVTSPPEKEINENLPQLRILMIKRKKENTRTSKAKPDSQEKSQKSQKPTKPSSEEDSSCIAQRTRSKLNRPSTSATSLKPKKSISSKIDTGLRRRSHPTNPMSAIPEETASTTVLTDEIEEQESPVILAMEPVKIIDTLGETILVLMYAIQPEQKSDLLAYVRAVAVGLTGLQTRQPRKDLIVNLTFKSKERVRNKSLAALAPCGSTKRQKENFKIKQSSCPKPDLNRIYVVSQPNQSWATCIDRLSPDKVKAYTMNPEALEATTLMLTAMAGSFALNNATLSIPSFDGKNIPLRDFIQDVRNGAAQITELQTPNFIKAVLAKLKGPARDSTFNKTFENVDALVKHLKERFAPGKNYAYYADRIHEARMRKSNTVGTLPIYTDAMGLKSAPSTFQRLMDNVLRGLQDVEMLVYLDDVIIYAKNLHEHQRKTKLFLDRLQMANLVLQTDEVHLLHKEAGFLGHIVSEKGVEPDPRKIEAISNWPRPTNVKKIRQYLGTTGYYRRFIKDYAKIASPLSNLTMKNKPFEWTEECETSFLTLKQHLCNAPILQFPDINQRFTLTTDASDYAIGAVSSQNVDGNDLPVSYLSLSLNKHEINYTTTDKECLATLYAMSIYRPYLLGHKFTLQSDHEPLNWMHSCKDPGQRLMRWMFKFSDYDYDFKYKPGKENVVADGLSRNPPERDLNQNLPKLKVMMEDLDKCFRISDSYNCEPTTPEKLSKDTDICEMNIWTNIKQKLEKCNIIFSTTLSTQWLYTKNTRTWLFSLPEPTEIQVKCQSERDEFGKLSGMGIISIRPGCTVNTSNIILLMNLTNDGRLEVSWHRGRDTEAVAQKQRTLKETRTGRSCERD
ncbi:unnamed protein product [Trichogramma brassicae]|uniref:RNA-directed DNA polymerase n=1 Tax=Trichogramma brassicae TaxID=86971 RepID=A0A6H5I287_9HYME|nr:unnamed protein product [Trichogramma brassicae]